MVRFPWFLYRDWTSSLAACFPIHSPYLFRTKYSRDAYRTLVNIVHPVHVIVRMSYGHPTRTQMMARFTLGVLCWMAFRRFNAATAFKFGQSAATWSALCWAFQFHAPFYLTRTLPNVFALCIVLLGLTVRIAREGLSGAAAWGQSLRINLSVSMVSRFQRALFDALRACEAQGD